MTVSELKDYINSWHEDLKLWLLEKHQWMSLYTHDQEPTPNKELLIALKESVEEQHRGIMLKTTSEDQNSDGAIFVVPDNWQQRSYDSLADSSEKPRHP